MKQGCHLSHCPNFRGPLSAPFTVVHLLTPLKMSNEAAKKRAEPYTKIVGELPGMRRDTVELVRTALVENRRAYVLVNNRSEGNAPLTVQVLVDTLNGVTPILETGQPPRNGQTTNMVPHASRLTMPLR